MLQAKDLGGLLDRAVAGDEGALQDLFEMYEHRVVNFVEAQMGANLRAKTTPESIMLSAMASVLIRVKGGKCLEPEKAWAYIKTVAENKVRTAAEYWTARKRDPKNEDKVPADEVGIQGSSRDLSSERMLVLRECLDLIQTRLKPEDFRIFCLWLQGHTIKEIADELELNYQTVRSKMRRAGDLIRLVAQDDSWI